MNVLSILLSAIKAEVILTPETLIFHFIFNLFFTFCVIHFLYYQRSKRTDYYFTFLIISSCIFLIIFMLSNLKIKMAFALGLFAVFGIMKYRTVSIPVREMTYLFALVTLSVINALGSNLGWDVLLVSNLLLVVLITMSEILYSKRKGVKYIKYDKIELCKKSKYQELIADIEERFELKVISAHVGSVNCLNDMALIKVYYEPDKDDNIDEEIVKFPKD